MYPAPLITNSFNYQSFHHQPILNLTQTNGFLRNQNKVQSENVEDKQISSLSKVISKTKNTSNSTTTEKSSKKRPTNSYTTRYSNQDRFLSRQSSLETIPTKRSTPLLNSRSLGTLTDRIQRERRAHTMAPLARISGPSYTPQAKMFATINAPTDVQTNKLNHLTQEKLSKVSYLKSDFEMTDDDTPIIVKVRYDPQTGVLPSEKAIRQAIDKKLIDKRTKKHPIVVNFFERNIQPQLTNGVQQNSFPHPVALQPSRTFPSVLHPPHPFLQNGNVRLAPAPKPLINRQQFQSLNIPRLPNRNISSAWTNGSYPTGFDTFKPIHHRMATQKPSTTINNQQVQLQRPHTAPSSTEIFRPPAVADIPELRRENLLNMLNQIPDLQGRHFNIEYASATAPEGYPIPLNFETASNTYPEPVVIDTLPTNILQHVKSSNNPALTAALEATIQRDQHVKSQATVSTLNVQPPTVVHHAAQPYQQVQQSRPVSSNDSESSTEVSSSETSSSEETDTEESEHIPSTKIENNISFVGPIPPTSYSQNQYR